MRSCLLKKQGCRQDEEPTINSPRGTSNPEQLILLVADTAAAAAAGGVGMGQVSHRYRHGCRELTIDCTGTYTLIAPCTNGT